MVVSPVTIEKVELALQRVPPQRLPEVLTFIEFLEYRAERDEEYDIDDPSEDATLWVAVEANNAYKAQHPGEMIIHESGEAF